MRRRDLIKSIGFAVVSGPLAAQAQPAQLRRRRLGVLLIGTPDSRTAQTAAPTRWLEELSWKTAVNLDLEYRWATGDEQHLRDQAADIASLSPDVILVESASGLSAMRQGRRRQFRSSSSWSAILSAAGSSLVSPIQAAPLRGSQTSSRRWAGSGWRCSKKLHLQPQSLRCCYTQTTLCM